MGSVKWSVSIGIFTGRNEVVAKVIFLHMFVILFTGGGVCLSTCWDTNPPGADPPRSRHPPPGSRLQHTVYERPVRILLECILVINGHGDGTCK